MKTNLFIVLFFLWAIPSGFAQLKSYTFEEAEQLSKTNPKPIVVFVHTSWCKICKMMENSTFKNPEIIAMLNDNFYFVSFDAETIKDITFNNHRFEFKPTGQNTGIHELANELATVKGQVSYPSMTILNPDYSIVFQKQSYLKANALFSILEKIKEFSIFETNSPQTL